MRLGAVIMLVVAVLLGGISTFAARNWIEARVSARPVATVVGENVVVARTALNFGDRIKPENLTLVPWPKASIPQGTFNKTDELVKGDPPRVALQRIEMGEPVLRTKISGFGGRATLSTVMNENNRAVTIRVNDITGVAGFLLPGDRVDVVMTRQEANTPVNSVLLQDVRILGVGQIASDKRDQPVVVRAVTVEATPVEAQKLILAQQIGNLSLVLRPITDRAMAAAKTVRVQDLYGNQTDVARTAPVAASNTAKKVRPRPVDDGLADIRIIRGLAVTPGKVPREGARVTARRANEVPLDLLPPDLAPEPAPAGPGAQGPDNMAGPEALGPDGGAGDGAQPAQP